MISHLQTLSDYRPATFRMGFFLPVIKKPIFIGANYMRPKMPFKSLNLTYAHFSNLFLCDCIFVVVVLGNKMRAEEQKRKEKAAKEEQKRAYGATLQLKQRQRAEVLRQNFNLYLSCVF